MLKRLLNIFKTENEMWVKINGVSFLHALLVSGSGKVTLNKRSQHFETFRKS